VNLTGWFQTSGAHQIQFTQFTKQDFTNIKSLGCDVIRLPINLHFMTNGEPDFILDPLFTDFLDSAVTWAEELQINLILDNHTFDPSVDTDPSIEGTLIKVWTQMAEHYKNRMEYIFYEILNEPHGISDALWGSIQGHVIDAIRAVDAYHTIIVGGAEWNSYNNLQYIPDYEDDNLIYTFHFYDPFLFTHQGATWTNPSMATLAGVPFPYHPDSMPDFPSDLMGTWIESSFNYYEHDGTVARVKELLDIAIDFSNTRNVPIFCGEFGVYIPNSPGYDRVAWYDTVRTYLESNGIAWTIWDYIGSFGIFEENGNGLFEYDLDTSLVRALGLNVPFQGNFVLLPDSSGFPIYEDYIENGIFQSSNAGTGVIDFYSDNKPNNGSYCIGWSGGEQYCTIGFDLRPNRDFSYLLINGFALDMMVRETGPEISFDVRFMDTKTDEPDDHPWRMRYTITEDLMVSDGRWHHVRIPLGSFTEHGAWDGVWYNPIGEYDWTALDRFEIVAEQQGLEGRTLWFDNIHISDLDTAQIYDTSAIDIVTLESKSEDSYSMKISPNPTNSNAKISYTLTHPSDIEICIYDMSGCKRVVITDGFFCPGNYTVVWDVSDAMGKRLIPGMYHCRLISGEEILNKRFILY
jgi:endoglucanase